MPDYYVQLISELAASSERFWLVDDTVAHAEFVPSELGTHYSVPGEEMITTLRTRYAGSTFHKLQLAPGQYFPRMARPNTSLDGRRLGMNPDTSGMAVEARVTGTGLLHALIHELQEICRVVHPSGANLSTYGHAIRNVIIIACTEVEAQWKNILAANGTMGSSTRDYVVLAEAMKLYDYEVALPWYPWLPMITPFHSWEVANGTSRSLPWYDAYNKIKHDRERNFAQATLGFAFDATAACFVMLCAQYGWSFARKSDALGDAFFQLIKAPTWAPGEIYVPLPGSEWMPRNYF